MTVHRPTRVTTTDEAIRDAVTAELLAFEFLETDAATLAHNVAQRIMLPEKVSDITGMDEDDAGHDPTPVRKLRVFGIPGQGPSK